MVVLRFWLLLENNKTARKSAPIRESTLGLSGTLRGGKGGGGGGGGGGRGDVGRLKGR